MKRLFAFLGLSLLVFGGFADAATPPGYAATILYNGKITTLDAGKPQVSAILIKGGIISATGSDEEILAQKSAGTRTIDLKQRTVIPGLIDSHMHIIRAGLNYNLELRWDGLTSLAEGLRQIREQAKRTPTGQWIRVVGGWSEFQFQEKRLPTLAELNEASPNTPVFVLHLYDRALLNQAAVRALGYTRETPEFPGGVIERDAEGNPTGLLVAKPNAFLLYASLHKAPKLSLADQRNSTLLFQREMNRLGVTSVLDPGGGFQNYPEDYQVVQRLAQEHKLTVRIAYSLFPQKPGEELADFKRWAAMKKPGSGDDFFRLLGAGEMLAFSAADFEDFLEPRPEMPETMEPQMKAITEFLVQNHWPFRMHATYDETIGRNLSIFEAIDRKTPLRDFRWLFDHAETISTKNLQRIKALGGGVAIQNRMYFQGEYFLKRYGKKMTHRAPPIREMLELGIPVGAGTDGTRVSSYNPFFSLHWLVAGKTIGGTVITPKENRLSREESLTLWTLGGAWFSNDEKKKGSLAPGKFADLAVLSEDYFSVGEDHIKDLQSILTVVGGKVVYARDEFAAFAPSPRRASPDWSPVNYYSVH